MTAIAYKDGIMAADESVNYGVIDLDPNKARRSHGYLIGVSGNNAPTDADFDDWFFSGIAKRKASSPLLRIAPFPMKAKFEILVVTPRRQILVVDERGILQPIYSKFWAVGSGGSTCIGAMAVGATARQAVAAAIRYDPGCRGRVRSVKLDDTK